jgi:hypothetical protein
MSEIAYKAHLLLALEYLKAAPKDGNLSDKGICYGSLWASCELWPMYSGHSLSTLASEWLSYLVIRNRVPNEVALESIWAKWPKMSGNLQFPVLGLAAYMEHCPRNVHWDPSTFYGQERLDLLNWMIGELRSNDEVLTRAKMLAIGLETTALEEYQ